MRVAAGLLLLALASNASAAPAGEAAAAPTVAVSARPSPAEALAFVQAFSPSDLRREGEIAVLKKSFIPGLKANPNTAVLLEAFPTLGDEIVSAMIGQIDTYVAEFDERFYPEATDIVRRSLSRDDAATLRQFYESPLGRKSLRLAVQNADGAEIMAKALNGEDIDKATTNRQIVRAGVTALTQLSPDERRQVIALALSPVGRRFNPVRAELAALQTKLANEPGPKFKAQSEKAIADAFQRVVNVNSNAKK